MDKQVKSYMQLICTSFGNVHCPVTISINKLILAALLFNLATNTIQKVLCNSVLEIFTPKQLFFKQEFFQNYVLLEHNVWWFWIFQDFIITKSYSFLRF